MKTKIYLCLFLCLLLSNAKAQNLSQTIKGKVVDAASESPVIGASVLIENTNPLLGAVTDLDGNFNIKNVSVGRYNLKISFIGYETIQLTEILVSSAKEVVLNIKMKENKQGKSTNEPIDKFNHGINFGETASLS